MIEGSYDLNGRRMHSYNRLVIPTGAPPANQRYLVQFTVTGYAEVGPGRMALTMGPGFTSASTVEYHLKRIYSAYGDYLNHTLAPVLELHANGAVIGDYTWDGLALSEKAGQGS